MKALPENHPLRKKIAKRESKAEARFDDIKRLKKDRATPTKPKRGSKVPKE